MRIGRLVVAAVAVVAISGCSGSDDPSDGSIDPDTFMPELISAMQEQGSVSIDMEVTGPDGLTAEGEMVFGDGEGESDAALRAEASGEKFEIRIVDGRSFIAYDSLTSGKFFELDTKNGSELEKEFGGIAEQLDPSAAFEPFADAVESVEEIGEPEEVAGVTAQHLRVKVAADRVTSPELKALPDNQVPDQFTYDFWVDDQGLLRRAEFELGGVGLKGDYLDYGETDEIPVPSGDEVTKDNPFAGASAA